WHIIPRDLFLNLMRNVGYCGIYEYRPGICRMFGAAGYKTKSGEATLSVCKPIKQAVPEKYAAALITIQPQHLDIFEKRLVDDIAANSEVRVTSTKPPMIAEGRQKLAQLDYELGERLMPINDALRFVLEKTLTLSFYAQDIDGGVAA
ncbi:YkgJ family cysteine cluster protein, partial [Pseudomonas sp. HMWF031]